MAGSPTPHTSSSTPTPLHPPPRPTRAEARKTSPARLPGDHVRPSTCSVVAIARATPCTPLVTPIVAILIINMQHKISSARLDHFHICFQV